MDSATHSQESSKVQQAETDPLLQELRLEGSNFVSPPPNSKYHRLYGHYLCPDVEVALIALALKKVPYQFASVDLPTRPEWFINGPSNGHIPLLEAPKRYKVYPDSLSICQHLDEISIEGPKLLPKSEKTNEILERIDKLSADFSKAAKSQGQDKASIEELQKNLEWFNNTLKGNKSKSPFFLDQTAPSVIDLMLIPHIRRIVLIEHTSLYNLWKVLDLYGYSNLVRWYSCMMDIEEVVLNTASKKWYVELVEWRAKTGQYTLPIFLSRKPFDKEQQQQ
eukprot:TRINITY_DN1931_c0_g1_i1.p2 TRINITY_DN1931_c0_g1~~TRINITY_DN1931_c0_g1_i1.p2  ORF type:complete len:279 (-),score=25.14 TRINITY_DN1931_c0_g1_i1:1115-1951(-)